jgi:hypothetical protein
VGRTRERSNNFDRFFSFLKFVQIIQEEEFLIPCYGNFENHLRLKLSRGL